MICINNPADCNHLRQREQTWNNVSERYLYDAISPALTHSVSSPHVVSVLSESLHQCVLVRGQFNMVEVQRSRFVAIALCIATFRML